MGTYEARRQRLRCDSPPRPQRHLDTFDLEAVRVGRGTRAVRSRVAAAGAQAECDQAENERVPRAHVCLLPVRGLTLIRTLGPIRSHHRIVVARKPDAGDLRSVRRGTTRRVPARGCCARAACHRLWRSGEQSSTTTDQVASNSTAHREKDPGFASLPDALDQVARHVDVPVVLPANLPAAARLTGPPIIAKPPDMRAQLDLLLPGKRVLSIQYGVAGFDGCEVPNLRAIRIGDQRALLASSHLHLSPGARLDGKQFATLLWPATKRTLQGRYGLSGPFSAQRLLSFARSMERARASAPGGRRPGC